MFNRNETTNKSFKRGTKNPSLLPFKTESTRNPSSADKNCSSSSVLSAANRFPYSSTPAVSPTHHIKPKDQTPGHYEGNENFKIPSVAKNRNRTVEFTAKNYKMSQKFPVNVSASISPIRSFAKNEVFVKTQPRSTNLSYETPKFSSAENVGLASVPSVNMLRPRLNYSLMSPGKNSKIETTMPLYPFPNVQPLKHLHIGEMLLNNLRILKMVQAVQIDREFQESRKIQDQSKGKGIKNKDKKREESSFKFTVDMFKNVNSQACLYVLHLLFECYNRKETEMMFRDCWPVFEKKLEGVFRRVALKWLKEIMETHPQFFPSLKQEAVGGLLVNPGGERFIQFVDSFAELVMFRIIHSTFDKSKCALNKPHYVGDSEISNRQILYLNKTSEKLMLDITRHRKQTVKNSSEVEKRMKILHQRKEMYQAEFSEVEEKGDRLLSLVGDCVCMKNEPDQCCNKLWFEINEKVIHINAGVDAALLDSGLKAVHVMKALDNFHDKYQRLWFILEMDRNKELVLDGSKLLCLNPKENTVLSLTDFIKCVEETSCQIMSDKHLNAALPSHILKKHKSEEFKFQYLKIIQQKMNDRETGVNLSSLTEDLKYQNKRLEVKLKDVNWQDFSKVNEKSTDNKAFLITPPKVFDFKKKTGYTPALLNFLPGSNDDTDFSSYQNMSCMPTSHNVSAVQKKFGNVSGNLGIGFEQKVCQLSSSMMSPIARFPSVGERSARAKVRVNISSNLSCPVTPQNTTDDNVTAASLNLEGHDDILEASTVSVSINIDNSALDVSVRSVRSDTMTPIGLDLSTQARIARIIGSLKSESPRSPTTHAQPFDFEADEADRLSTEIMNRMSLSSTQTNNSQLNLSLMGDWNDEKGIMDVSCALDESDSDN